MSYGFNKKAALPLLAPLVAKAGAVATTVAPVVARFGRPALQVVKRIGTAGTQHLVNGINQAYRAGMTTPSATNSKALQVLRGSANLAKAGMYNYATKFPYDYPYIKQAIDTVPSGFLRSTAKVGAGVLGAPYMVADKVSKKGVGLYDKHLQNRLTSRTAPSEYELSRAQYFSDLSRRNNGLPVHKNKYSGMYNPRVDAYSKMMSAHNQ